MSHIMKKKVFCLSGWAQKPNSLETLFLENSDYEIINFDYSKFTDFESLVNGIISLKIKPEIIIGWSLGGQLACRLIEEKIFDPQFLILLAAPFQFVKSPRISAAMPQKSYDEFVNNFVQSPDKTLKRFSILMNINDKDGAKLAENLDINDENHQKLAFWLKELGRFSCYDLRFNNFPKTLIIHGFDDMVVHVIHAKIFQEKIFKSQLEIIQNCGHVPHLRYLNNLRDKILDFINNTCYQ